MRHYQGLVWYQRRFDTDAGISLDADQRQFLRFGAVNYRAKVWLNGEFIGTHAGGFTPFALEVTGKLRPSDNRLVVSADSARTALDVPPPVTDWETYGGITRDVRLIGLPETYVDDAWVRLTDLETLAIDVSLSGADAAGQSVTVTIAELGLTRQLVADDSGRASASLPLPTATQLWSPDRPKLYAVEVTAGEDRWRDTVGLRTIEASGSQVLLNGQPIFLRGISIHEEELGLNPSRRLGAEQAAALLSVVKHDLNGNFVRLAHYPHGEAMVRMADTMGLLVWSEIPVYWRVAFDQADTLADARNMLREMVLRDRSRASVIVWSVANETPQSPARNAFLRTLVADTRALDATRLVSAALLIESEERDGVPTLSVADPLAADLDLLSVNTYNGWYGPDRPDQVPRYAWDLPTDRPFFFSEFGAGAKLGYRAGAGQRAVKFTEDYQAEYYRNTLAMADKVPTLVGMSPWILKDFRSPRRQLPAIQDGWNRKGLITPLGEKKLAFDVLAQWYEGKANASAD